MAYVVQIVPTGEDRQTYSLKEGRCIKAHDLDLHLEWLSEQGYDSESLTIEPAKMDEYSKDKVKGSGWVLELENIDGFIITKKS